MKIIGGELTGAKQFSSPHFNTRPDPKNVSLLVIHNISLPAGKFGTSYVEDLFLGRLNIDEHSSFRSLKGLRVSSHLLIRRDGSIEQYVNLNKRAWHAGESCFGTQTNCNDFSIGIELEGTDDLPYDDRQYRALTPVVEAILSAFPLINSERICGHSDIAPGRKTDPGPAFDWGRFWSSLNLTN